MPIGGYVAIAFVIVILLILSSCIKIVPQAQAYVVERLGAYQGTWSVGLHFKVPFIQNSMLTVWSIRSWRLRT